MTTSITAAIVQMDSQNDKALNTKKALAFCQEAVDRGSDIIVLPEVFNYRSNSLEMKAAAEPIPGPTTALFSEFARQQQVTIVMGSIVEVGDGDKCYNSSVVIAESGEIAGVYRKMHLFNVDVEGKSIQESKAFLAGETPVCMEWKDRKLGLSICYDVRFPELYRHYATQGATILTAPSSFTYPTGEAHWEILLRARAIENQCFILAPNQVGLGAESVPTYGNSMIVDPWGKVVVRANETDECVLVAQLDTDFLENIRRSFPCLNHQAFTSQQ